MTAAEGRTRADGSPTDNALLDLYGSAFISGGASILTNAADVPPAVAHAVTESMVRDMMTDPAIRDTIITSARTILAGEHASGMTLGPTVHRRGCGHTGDDVTGGRR